MLIIGMIFSVFIKMTNYYLFLFTGIIVWQFFSQSLSRSTTIFLNDRSLLQKARFSTYIMPISVVASNFVHLIAAIIMLVFYLIFSKSGIIKRMMRLKLKKYRFDEIKFLFQWPFFELAAEVV